MNLVFASGFGLPQGLPIIDYFNGVKERFGGQHDILFPAVQPVGRSEQRARRLADAIRDRQFQGPIHIIAHSMGGLDSRYLIGANHHGLAEPGRIKTLTTLSTPHKGSPIADLLLGWFFTRLLYRAVTGSIGALGIIATGALEDLTAEGAAKVPNILESHPHISVHCYGATGRTSGKPTSVPFRPSYDYIFDHFHQPNDGLVAAESAKYGEFQGNLPCDHADLIGHDLDFGRTGFAAIHLAAYQKIIDGLPARM